MENLFDGLQKTAFAVVSNTIGYNGSWTPSNDNLSQTARILFKDATETAKLLQIEYDPERAIMEYYIGSFAGLKPMVDAKSDEFVTISNVRYFVDSVEIKEDGKTFLAHIRRSE